MMESALAGAILSRLLDKYEESAAFRGQGMVEDGDEQHDGATGPDAAERIVPIRRAQVRMTDAIIPRYVSGGMDPDERKALHGTLQRWADGGVVALKWVKHEAGNMLDRVYLQPAGTGDAYALLGRTPKAEDLERIAAELTWWRSRLSADWMQRWLDDIEAVLRTDRRLSTSLIFAEDDKRTLLLQALQGLVVKGDEELSVRLFSTRYLKSSKVFEVHIKRRLVGLLRRYVAESSATTEEDVLAGVGVVTSPEDISFCGPIRFSLGHGVVDGAQFPGGLSLDVASVRRLEMVDMPVRRVLTIENKANYRHYVAGDIQADELVVYLGGFHSPGKRLFLRQVREAVTQQGASVAFHHWGDLDYGGILILQSLREAVLPELMPWRMEPEWLVKLQAYVEPFDDAYREKLALLLRDRRYELHWALVDKLLEIGGTLEQEAFLV